MQEYIKRNIDKQLIAWKDETMRKPILLRGARQVGKSSAVRHFGKSFIYFAEKHLTEAFRCSLENFGELEYIDKEDNDAVRHVSILHLYALSMLK